MAADATPVPMPSSDRMARLILENATDYAIFTTDLAGVITSWNPGAERLLGWSEAEAVGRPARMIFTPEDDAQDACAAEMEGAREAGRAEDERWHVRRDGTRFWSSGLLMRFEDEGTGAHIGYLKILRDRTTQHEANERLRDSETVTRALFEGSADCVMVLDLDGRLLSMNEPGLRLLDIDDAGSILGEPWASVWPEAMRAEVNRALKVARAGAVGRFYGFGPTAKGMPKWWDVQVSPVLGADGAPKMLLSVSRDVTERARQAQAFAENEAYLRLLLDSSGEGFYAIDREGRTTLCNAAFLRLLGFAREEDVIGRKLHEVIHHSHANGSHYHEADCPIFRTAQTGEPAHVEGELFYRLDGTGFPVEYRAYPIRRGGALQGAICTFSDITERVRAGTALRASEARLQAVLESVSDGFYALDADWRFTVFNAAAERYFRRPRAEVIGRTLWEAFPEAVGSAFETRFREIAASGEALTFEARSAARPDRVVEMRAAPKADGGLAVAFSDVTERRAAEDALRESEARLRVLADNLPAGMVYQLAMRADGGDRRFLYVSQSSGRLTGVSPEAALADPRALYDIVLPEHRPALAAAENAAIAGRTPFDHEAPFRGADGAVRWGRIISAPRRLPDGSLVWDGLFIDITDQKAAEERLRDSEDRLRLALKTAEVGIWDFNPVTGTLRWDDRCKELFGLPPSAEVDYDRFLAGLHPDDRVAADAAVQRALAPDGPGDLAIEYRTIGIEDGVERWIAATGRAVLEGEGAARRATRFIGTVLDVSERKRTDTALRESEAHYRHAAELNPQVAWTATPDGQLDRVAERWRAWTGTSGLGETWGQGLHADDLGYTAEAWVRSVVTGAPYDVEHRVKMLSGDYRWARSRAFPRRDAEGRIVKWYGSTEDIHERKLAEEQRREESRTLETLNRTGAALAAELDLERIVQMVTDAGVELTGAGFGAFFYNTLNEAGESLMLYTLSGAERSAFEGFGIPRATAVFQPTFKGEGVIRSDDILADPRYGQSDPHRGMPKGHLPVRSYLAVSVTSRSGDVIGGLFFGHPEPGRFTERHERLILGIAAQAAIAIDNARLYQAAQRELAERRRAEEELRLRGDEFYALADNIATLCWIAYADGHIFWYNRRWYEYTGTTPESQEGWGWESVHDPERLPAIVARWKHSLDTGEPFEMTFPLKGADGAFRPFLTRIVPIRDERGRIVRWFGTNVDVSAHVETERLLERRVAERTVELEAANERLRAEMEERQRAEEALRQAQKMEAVGQLTGGIAHDFNNLLTGVIGSLDMMQRRIARGETDRIERYANAAVTSANRAAALTHRLLAFSRRQPLDPKPVNANRLVTGMEELLRRTIGEAISLEIVTAGGLWQTLCDPHQLESALLNLAINARDAMPDGGGTLTIETCNAHLDNAYAAQSREVRPGQYICICVTDTGTGMTADVMAKAFDPFFTTKPIGQGTGLGLSMIYGFARQSEGYVKLYSEIGQGTTVKLYLPRYYGEADDAEEAAGQAAEAQRAEHGEVVLVVEDETAVRELVVDVLQELGYRAVEAADGPSGLRLVQSNQRIDLLVTDVGLPGLNGRQLADAARQHRPGLKVMFMTGYAENAAIASGFLEPGMQMITKPFAIEALATRIRDMIESG